VTASTAAPAQPIVKQVVITRTFDAPRSLVFEAWSTPAHMKNWFGPAGFTLPICEMDFRAGGSVRVCMRSPDGEEFWSKGTFREIVVPERIVMESALLDDKGKPRFEDRNIVTFAERGGKTVVTVTANILKIHDPTAASAIDGMEEGWNQTLDRLATYLATKR
jgi:uncharacterized protein YndB with AHSA1/START domain